MADSTVTDGAAGPESELEALREQQHAISGVLRALAQSAGLQPVLDEVVEACRRLCRADTGRLWLLDGDMLVSVAHDGGGAEGFSYDKEHPHALDRSTAAGRAAVTRRPVHIRNVDEDPEYTYSGPRPYKAMLGAPILIEDELIGVVVVVRTEPIPFSDDQVALIQTFADQAAVAIANARLLETVERQRTELARFVSPPVAELITSEEGKQLLAGHRAYITIAYFDLRGFTAFAETAEPEEMIDIVREYHATTGELVTAHSGTLEHFAGDGLMVFLTTRSPSKTPSSRRPGSPSRCGTASGSWLQAGAGVATSWVLGRGSPWATRPSDASASRVGTTMAPSAASRTSRPG